MSAPDPRSVERQAERAITALRHAVEDYAWFYESGYRRRGAGAYESDVHGGSLHRGDISALLVGAGDGEDEAPRDGGTSSIRRKLYDAARDVDELTRRALHAEAAMRDLAKLLDGREPERPTERVVEPPRSRADVDRARSAQRRARARMEGRAECDPCGGTGRVQSKCTTCGGRGTVKVSGLPWSEDEVR